MDRAQELCRSDHERPVFPPGRRQYPVSDAYRYPSPDCLRPAMRLVVEHEGQRAGDVADNLCPADAHASGCPGSLMELDPESAAWPDQQPAASLWYPGAAVVRQPTLVEAEHHPHATLGGWRDDHHLPGCAAR